MANNFTNNEMKLETLSQLEGMTNALKLKLAVLDALDRDESSGCCDLHDQMTTFHKLAEELGQCVNRATSIVPTEGK